MAQKQTNHPGIGWFTKAEAAALFGVSETYFDRDYRRLAPPDAVREVDRRLYFRTRAIVDALVARAEKKSKPPAPVIASDNDDVLLNGPESPALERYREERALMARMDRLEREGQLVPRSNLDPALDQLASIYRRAGETLQRRFGPEAIQIVNEAVDEVEKRWEQVFGERDDDGSKPDPDEPPADGGQDSHAEAADPP